MAPVPAILGGARLGNFRLKYEPAALTAIRATRVRYVLAGANPRVRVTGLTIHDVLNNSPNTCTLTIDGTPAPVAAQTLRVLINSDTPRLLFNGALQTVGLYQEELPGQWAYPCTATDDLARLNRRRPFGTWANVSATPIAQYLVATFAPGFSVSGIAASLPAVSVNFDGSEGFAGCFTQLAKLIGGYWKAEDLVVWLFLADTSDPPDPLNSSSTTLLLSPPITATTDTSQLRTRQAGTGHGEATLSAVAAGETIVPVSNAPAWFNVNGGRAISDTQRLAYTGVQTPGGATMVGPAVSPGVAPTIARIVGAGVEVGVHGYAAVWVTALGKSLPSPIRWVTLRAALPTPGAAPGYGTRTQEDTLNLGAVGDTVAFTYSYSAAELPTDLTAESAVSPSTGAQTLVASTGPIPGYSTMPMLLVAYSTDVDVRWIHLWVSRNGGAWNRSGWVEPNVVSGQTVTLRGGDPVTADVVPSTGALQRTRPVVPLGPTGTTSRELYRTIAGGSALLLQQTIADNTTTAAVTDSTPDASLGAAAPTTNTSGLPVTIPPAATFDTTATFFGGVNGFSATLATSAAPVVTSALYTFVAADVGASVYIKTGTNWIPGFYRIVSVAGGAATVDRACATVASPTQATAGVDFSMLVVPRISLTDLAITATPTTCTSTALATVFFALIGNSLNITGGVGFTVQRVTIRSTSGANILVDNTLGIAASTGGAATLGGLASPSTIAPGSASILTQGGDLSAAGGWVRIGTQLIRYAGVTGNTLTGIPASGVGAITTTIRYGTLIEPLPALTGVTGIVVPLRLEAPVHLWVQRDDRPAQATQAVIDATNGRVPADGIWEGVPIVDAHRNEASLVALCDATLALFSRPLVTLTYATRDVKTKSGKSIVVNLTNPPISATLTIQDVTISEIDIADATPPTFTVTASNVRFSLDDLLRRMAAAAGI
jgi:hypothetical protein